MKESFATELWKYTRKQWDELLEWIKPEPTEALGMKILKGFLKSIVVLILIALSPVIIIVLVVAFIAAF